MAILNPTFKALVRQHIPDTRIVLSKYFRKWCLTGLENGIPAVKKELLCHAPLLVTAVFMGRLNLEIYVPYEAFSH